MKTNWLKLAFIPLLGITGLIISAFSNSVDSLKPANVTEKDWADSIAAALQSDHIVQINGEYFIVDMIPCSSSADHGFFDRKSEYVYVDCATCKKTPCKPRPDSYGQCTNVRKYEGLK